MSRWRCWIDEMRRRVDRYRLAHGCRRTARRAPREPLVTFTFDDFPRSAYCQGGSILRSHGARGTYYASLGFMGSRAQGGEFFTLDDLHQLLEDGQELGCHTHGHLKCAETPRRAYEQDILKNAAEAARLLGGYRFRHFAYPYGSAAGSHKRMLARHFETLRTVESGINAGRFDLNGLRANRLYSGSIPLENVMRLIDQNVRSPGWLIFYTHDVCSSPSPYGCTPEYFEQVVAATARSGSRIVTTGQAFEEIHRPSSDQAI